MVQFSCNGQDWRIWSVTAVLLYSFFKKNILLKYSWFTNVTLVSAVHQYSYIIHVYIYIFFFIFFPIMVYHRILNIVSCAILQDLVYPLCNRSIFFFFKSFVCVNHFKSICYNIASVLCFGFWPQGMWDLRSWSSDQTHTTCIGRRSRY